MFPGREIEAETSKEHPTHTESVRKQKTRGKRAAGGHFSYHHCAGASHHELIEGLVLRHEGERGGCVINMGSSFLWVSATPGMLGPVSPRVL